jgi:hypothetical protein
MTYTPLSGYYDLKSACRALSDKNRDVYPELLLRHVLSGNLNTYKFIDEYDLDLLSEYPGTTLLRQHLERLDFFALSEEDRAALVGQIFIPKELVRLAIEHYECYRSDEADKYLKIDFYHTHWYPRTMVLVSLGQEVNLQGDSLNYLEFPITEIYFDSAELNSLFGLAPLLPVQPPQTKARNPADKPLLKPYHQLYRQLAEIQAGPIPEQSVKQHYLQALTINLPEWQRQKPQHPVADNVATWKQHLIGYQNAPARKVLPAGNFIHHLLFLIFSVAKIPYEKGNLKQRNNVVQALIKAGVHFPKTELEHMLQELEKHY